MNPVLKLVGECFITFKLSIKSEISKRYFYENVHRSVRLILFARDRRPSRRALPCQSTTMCLGRS